MDENSTVNFLVSRKSECMKNYLSYHSITGGSHKQYDTLSFEDYGYYFTKSSYRGECRGVLYFERIGDILVCNPTTKELKVICLSPIELPLPAHSPKNCFVIYTCSGFGYDATSEDFKIVRLIQRRYYGERRRRDFICQLYEFRTNSWKEIKYPTRRLYKCCPSFATHVNGTLYWIASLHDIDDDVLLSFDLAKEEFSMSSLPFQRTAAAEEYNYNQDLYEVDGKLASFVYLNPKYYPEKSFRDKSIITNKKRIRNKKRNKYRIISNKRIRIRVWEEGMWKEVFNMAFDGVVTPLGIQGHLLFFTRQTKTACQLQVYDLLTEKVMRLDVHNHEDKMDVFPYNQSQYRLPEQEILDWYYSLSQIRYYI